MVAKKIKDFLNQNGFAGINGKYPEVTYWYRIQDNAVIYFCVCDFSEGIFLFDRELTEDFNSVHQSHFAERGYNKAYKLSIVCTHDYMAARNAVKGSGAYWLVGLDTYKLVIYEDQPEDYCNCRKALEGLLDRITEGTVRKVRTSKAQAGGLAAVFSINHIIVAVNILVFIVLELIGDTTDAYFLYEHGAMFPPAIIEDGEYYRLFTAMFIHIGIGHLMSNMIALFFIGDNVERALGKLKYVLIYILSGLCASLASFWFNMITDSNIVSAGASGAIFGIDGALLYIVWSSRRELAGNDVIRFTLMLMYSLFVGFTNQGVDNVAHIGGLIAGFILSILFYHKKHGTKESSL